MRFCKILSQEPEEVVSQPVQEPTSFNAEQNTYSFYLLSTSGLVRTMAAFNRALTCSHCDFPSRLGKLVSSLDGDNGLDEADNALSDKDFHSGVPRDAP